MKILKEKYIDNKNSKKTNVKETTIIRNLENKIMIE